MRLWENETNFVFNPTMAGVPWDKQEAVRNPWCGWTQSPWPPLSPARISSPYLGFNEVSSIIPLIQTRFYNLESSKDTAQFSYGANTHFIRIPWCLPRFKAHFRLPESCPCCFCRAVSPVLAQDRGGIYPRFIFSHSMVLGTVLL